ncbi:MAG: hypothetical protein DMF07_00720 [Verrucomicrobia bacterium]|nr:MAG: hypothetical protein DMF07_00720 [Verrucomicrobiota bacterium]
MYALRTMISDARGLLEIESGTARRVAIQAMSGKAIPNTTSTTTAATTSKLLLRKSVANAHA